MKNIKIISTLLIRWQWPGERQRSSMSTTTEFLRIPPNNCDLSYSAMASKHASTTSLFLYTEPLNKDSPL